MSQMPPIQLEHGWEFMQNGIQKLKIILEGNAEMHFSAEDYISLYTYPLLETSTYNGVLMCCACLIEVLKIYLLMLFHSIWFYFILFLGLSSTREDCFLKLHDFLLIWNTEPFTICVRRNLLMIILSSYMKSTRKHLMITSRQQ